MNMSEEQKQTKVRAATAVAVKSTKKFGSGFKKFISRGNVIDLAVGVMIGAAFGKIVSSLVNDIFMPIIGVLVGGTDFSALSIEFGDVTITYGNFLQNVIDFIIVAFCIYVLISIIHRMAPKKEETQKVTDKKGEKLDVEQNQLLTEIRDELRKANKKK